MQLMGRPKYLNDKPEGRSNHRPEGLAEEEQHLFSDSDAPFPTGGLTSVSSPPPDSLSDWKAWPKHYFQL